MAIRYDRTPIVCGYDVNQKEENTLHLTWTKVAGSLFKKKILVKL